jgi:hypothetical protein
MYKNRMINFVEEIEALSFADKQIASFCIGERGKNRNAKNCCSSLDGYIRVARFFSAQHNKKEKHIPNDHEIYQILTKYSK